MVFIIWLKYPNSTVNFSASPAHALTPFQVYDRDEWENCLSEYDPNDFNQMKPLFNEYFSKLKDKKYNVHHKAVVMLSLEKALLNENYNFAKLLESDDETCFYFPYNWKIEKPRVFLRVFIV
ncbi:Uncharacterised protein [Acinetobacter baumannii]|uniref:hypothetical protein n=1 Tax=Acinetobacter baumannii TaxID=470 RepID=UPI000DE6D60C|nr:hypothetical protein [Acinetobacter baumannii]MDC4839871.1 hypothetical protein [Acinetobacter baumannii]SSI19579.1 Uncharacterised protein [Acinetobacter baumannii]SSO10046.1 Uncharacterised protein [Acinetobacter baumannii]SSO45590.1 Uncharacterised protein [Acinetobacter baumannii]